MGRDTSSRGFRFGYGPFGLSLLCEMEPMKMMSQWAAGETLKTVITILNSCAIPFKFRFKINP